MCVKGMVLYEGTKEEWLWVERTDECGHRSNLVSSLYNKANYTNKLL